MAEHISVFISSTSHDLLAYREAVARAILRLEMYPIDMANFTSTDSNALQLCYDKVQETEIFIGIYAHRYGYAPLENITYRSSDGTVKSGDGETSITHFEYLWTIERNIPILTFVVAEDVTWPEKDIEGEPGKTRLKQFKDMVLGRHVVDFFHSPDHLASQVATAIAAKLPTIRKNIDEQVNNLHEDHRKLLKLINKRNNLGNPSNYKSLSKEMGLNENCIKELSQFLDDLDYVSVKKRKYQGIVYIWLELTVHGKKLVLKTR